LYLCGMFRRGDQQGARLLSDIIRTGNHGIRAPNQPGATNFLEDLSASQIITFIRQKIPGG